MLKMLALMKRKKGISYADFVTQYEEGHVHFCAPYLPRAVHYERRFIEPLENALYGQSREPDFDVITEIWFKDRADFDADMAGVGAADAAFAADEEKLFDRARHRLFIIEHEAATRSAR